MSEPQSKKIEDVAGCLIKGERQFLMNYAANMYTGQGAIVDLGCFLGSSTYALAQGLEDNTQVTDKSKRILAYDRFEWNAWMERPAERYGLAKKYNENDCFVDEFERQMGDKTPYIKTVKGDLTELKWESDQPIEYLFVDSMKMWDLCNSIMAGFYPAMKPGLSYLHHQDFVFFGTYWIHLTMFRMKDYFESVDHDYMGPSKVFKYTKQMPSDFMNIVYSLDDFSVSEINDAMDYSEAVVADRGKLFIAGARIHAMVAKKEYDVANSLMEEAKTKYPKLLEHAQFKMSYERVMESSRAAA